MGKQKISKERFEELYKQDLNDVLIAEKLKVTPGTVMRFRHKYGYKAIFKNPKLEAKPKEINQEQLEILTGTLIGDSSLQFTSSASKNPIYTVYHGEKQRDYSLLLADKLFSLEASYKEYLKHDKRRNVDSITCAVITKSNPLFIPLYNNLYINGTKTITKEFLDNFTLISLAYLYMDDGYYSRNTAFICTDCFDLDSVKNLINHCEKKFDLRFNYEKHGHGYRLRLKVADFKLFKYLISPYIIDTLKYKLGTSVT